MRTIVVQEPEGETIHSASPKDAQKAFGQRPRVIPVARIETRLAAAGLIFGKVTSKPARWSTAAMSKPTCGMSWSTKHGMNIATFGMVLGVLLLVYGKAECAAARNSARVLPLKPVHFQGLPRRRSWLGGLDSNQDKQIQNLLYCQLYDLPAEVVAHPHGRREGDYQSH